MSPDYEGARDTRVIPHYPRKVQEESKKGNCHLTRASRAGDTETGAKTALKLVPNIKSPIAVITKQFIPLLGRSIDRQYDIVVFAQMSNCWKHRKRCFGGRARLCHRNNKPEYKNKDFARTRVELGNGLVLENGGTNSADIKKPVKQMVDLYCNKLQVCLSFSHLIKY